jgi:hypothetical protein
MDSDLTYKIRVGLIFKIATEDSAFRPIDQMEEG